MLTKLKIKRFLKQLEGPKGCNFCHAPNSLAWAWHCDGTFKKAKTIMTEMKFTEEEIGRVLDISQNNGGFCDCEMLFNTSNTLIEEFK